MGKLAQVVKPKPNGCIFGDMIERYAEDDEDRAAVISPNVTAAAVWKFVSQEWEQVGLTTVKAHRAKECACFRGVA
ncbi:hypothetical protein [Arthrobacter bambusae]|uniref:hypothetical protein n=1 Tax=Arthrobacter bambusae TaxID=1338426 RepID=UPI002780231F|nr:hypothetical protein [Arthrobacter bambusae]MDQ0241182.1 hypothetical protein [Arthrobacter bambusae]